ncbi:MAG: hypothetical protein ONB05_08080 [candidate division KSB1 bacterium]|nr:hypothetical protein [candidate division KSB1 bacterium]
MRRNLIIVLLLAVSLVVVYPSAAQMCLSQQHKHEASEGQSQQHKHEVPEGEVSIIGEVICPVCFLRHDSRGKDHKECALTCAKAGITLAILEEKTGDIYLAFPTDHDNPNEKVLDYLTEKVKVTGKLYAKGGLKGLEVKTIEKVKK